MTHATIDAPGTKCATGNKTCTAAVLGSGGLQEHHELPKFLGGADDGVLLALCPNHHVRLHSLIRYLIESPAHAEQIVRLDGLTPLDPVARRFKPVERQAAVAAYDLWVSRGRPSVNWAVPAARSLP